MAASEPTEKMTTNELIKTVLCLAEEMGLSEFGGFDFYNMITYERFVEFNPPLETDQIRKSLELQILKIKNFLANLTCDPPPCVDKEIELIHVLNDMVSLVTAIQMLQSTHDALKVIKDEFSKRTAQLGITKLDSHTWKCWLDSMTPEHKEFILSERKKVDQFLQILKEQKNHFLG